MGFSHKTSPLNHKGNMNKYKAILFDMDGVLINSMSCHLKAFSECLEQYGIELTEGEIAGRSTLEILSGLNRLSLAPDEIRELARHKSARSLEIMKEMGSNLLFPDAVELIYNLESNFDLALCTSASPATVSYVTQELIPARLFKCILDSSDVREAKPSPEIYQKACSELLVDPDRCLVVEDSHAGVLAGSAAGCNVAYVHRGTYPSTIDIDGVVVVPNLVEILTLLT